MATDGETSVIRDVYFKSEFRFYLQVHLKAKTTSSGSHWKIFFQKLI